MLIGKNYKVESDALNVTLYERKVSNKSGKELWCVIGYYSTPANALHALVNLKVLETELKDLHTVVKKIDEVNKQIEQAVGGMK